MQVERQMCTVKRNVVFKGDFQLSTQRSRHRSQTWPKQTVRHDQKIDILFCRGCQDPCRGVNARSDFTNASGVFDLQTIKRVVPVAYFTNAQKIICIVNNFRERRHDCVSYCTAKIDNRPSIPRTSCGGTSSKLNESPERSRTAAVTSSGFPVAFVSPSTREAIFTVFPMAVNSSRCGEPMLAGLQWFPIPISIGARPFAARSSFNFFTAARISRPAETASPA